MVKVNTGLRWWIPLSIVVTIAVIAGGLWYLAQPKLTTVNLQGLSLQYDSGRAELSEVVPTDENGNVFARITPVSEDDQFLVSLRFQAGLQAASSATGQSPLELVSQSMIRSYPDQYPNLRESNERNLTIADTQAYRFTFTYDSPSGEEVRVVSYAIELNTDKVLLISGQSNATDFDRIFEELIEPIVESIKF